MWSRVIREAYSDAPKAKFMLHAGDLINRAESDAEWGEWHGAGAWLNAMIPSVPVLGNHEQARDEEGNRRLSHHWRPQFALPENGPPGLEETCYTFVYQNLRIIGLDSNREIEKQAAWLEQVLQENKWIERNVTHFGGPRKSGEDCHETAAAELAYLQSAGFAVVDCPWHRHLWGILRGTKQ
jgi:hypothetical protein